MKKTILLITSIVCFALGATSVNGALSYWDSNGTDPGAADAFGTAPGFWGLDNFWNASSDGTGTPGAWTDNNTAVFAAGTDAIYEYDVELFANQNVAGIIFEEGQVNVKSGTITLTAAGGPIEVGPPTSQPTIGRMGSQLSGTVGLTKTGSGTLFLINTAIPDYTGLATNIGGVDFPVGTHVDQGALAIGNGTDVALGEINRTVSHVITVATNAALIFNRGANYTFSGLITGNGSVIKAGTNTAWVKLGAGAIIGPPYYPDNDYTGDTIIELGKIIVAGTNGHAIPTGPGKGNVILSTTAAQLDIGTKSSSYPGPYNISINGLFGTGCVTNSKEYQTNFLMVGNADVSSTYEGVIAKASGAWENHVILTKIGTGTLTLTGPSTYFAAPTTVMAGTLLANCPTHSGESSSTGNSPVNVNSGATLGGIGTINGPVTIDDGGTLSPGSSVGKLILYNNLTLAGNLYIEVNKPTNDVVSVAGTLSNTGSGNTITVVNVGGSLTVGDKFQIFTDGSGVPKAMSNGGALTVVSSGVTWINNLGVDGSITVASAGIPEPNITSISRVGTTVTVNYSNCVVGKTYYLQYKSPITAGAWTTNTPGKVATGASEFQTDTTASGSQRYYQVFVNP